VQFIYGDEILESEFLEQKQCFGLTEPINTIFSVNALTESFWKVALLVPKSPQEVQKVLLRLELY
jgi:hypothetical protein